MLRGIAEHERGVAGRFVAVEMNAGTVRGALVNYDNEITKRCSGANSQAGIRCVQETASVGPPLFVP